jgi:hypothetical protein
MNPSGHGVDPTTDPVEVLLGVDREVRVFADVAAKVNHPGSTRGSGLARETELYGSSDFSGV